MTWSVIPFILPVVPPWLRPLRLRVHALRAVAGWILVLIAAAHALADTSDPSGSPQRLAKLEAPATRHARAVAAAGDTDRAGLNPCLRQLADDPAEALDYAQDWLRHGGGSEAAQCAALSTGALGDPAAAAASLDGLALQAGLAPTRRAILADEAAQAWMLAARPDRALQVARTASRLMPDDPDLLIDQARAAAESGRPAEAVAVLGRVLATHPARADALVVRAGAYRKLDRLSEAHADIEAACLLAPDTPEALLERGVVRERLGDLDGARQDWTRILSVSPDAREADLAQQDLALLDAGPEAR